jgi:hypothetical protein
MDKKNVHFRFGEIFSRIKKRTKSKYDDNGHKAIFYKNSLLPTGKNAKTGLSLGWGIRMKWDFSPKIPYFFAIYMTAFMVTHAM